MVEVEEEVVDVYVEVAVEEKREVAEVVVVSDI